MYEISLVANRSLKILRLFANLFLNKYEWWTLCENSLKQYIAQISQGFRLRELLLAMNTTSLPCQIIHII